ncbi:hypothetical protein WMY93_002263 [Mugilogobius chulae]|uniref:Nucleoporin NUP35 n=1 Tax=Mugilogobius chulae TaxID=88201 RepID=A0AAW0Q402_9GOBI
MVGSEPMTLGSPTSPKPASGAQFLPGFLMGDLPAPSSPQSRPFGLGSPLLDSSQGVQQLCMSPAQVDPFYSQGETLNSEDQLDQTWVTVFGFPPAAASYILLQFAQYGNILHHSMASPGNWMHLQYQSKLQARKALSKDGKVFGDAIMVGVKPCIDKSVMDSADLSVTLSSSSVAFPSTPRSTIRPLSAAQRASASDYQVVSDRKTPRKDDSFVSKAMEYMFGW